MVGTTSNSIEQILPPLVITLGEHPHQVPAGMQTERARHASQAHVRFLRSPIALAVVAPDAAGDEVLPRTLALARARHYMVERQLARRQGLVAVLAGVTVAQQNVLARQGASLVWNTAVFE